MSLIYAISICKNEEDIIVQSIEHLLANGIDKVLIADHNSTDNTYSLLKFLKEKYEQIDIFLNTDQYFHQDIWMNKLAEIAGNEGAEWIIPFDIDEFFFTRSSLSLSEQLQSIPNGVKSFNVGMYRYHGTEMREVQMKPHPKVIFRWELGINIAKGNHSVYTPTKSDPYDNFSIVIGELQYRSLEHFIRKIRTQYIHIDPSWGLGDYAHVREIGEYNDKELTQVWNEMKNRNLIYDPIPLRNMNGI